MPCCLLYNGFMELTTILMVLILIGIVVLVVIFLNKKDTVIDTTTIEEVARLKAELSQKDQRIGELSSDLQIETTGKDELSGKNKQLFVEKTNLKAENDSLLKDKGELIKELSNFKATEETRRKEHDTNIQKLSESKNALDDEKQRIRREDEQKLEKEKEERNRMWAEHEDNVKIQLTDLCKAPQYAFQYYDNKNLPVEFGGKFKPDFMLEFLGQYVIFDAKISESDLQNYINGNVKATVEKINSNPKIYSSVFFKVPTDALRLMKKIRFYEQGYDFFVIPPEAIEIVLASLRKISSYELAQQLDPRERENIVNLIAEFDYHIHLRNALDVLGAESGASVLKKVDTLKNDIKDEITLKKSKMRLQQFTPTDIKTLMIDTEMQKEKIDELTLPKAAISEEDIKIVKPILRKRS